MKSSCACWLAFVLGTLPLLNRAEAAAPDGAKSRTFLFTYNATVKDLPPDKTARVWIPLAQSSPEQDVQVVSIDVPAAVKASTGTDKQYSNKILYVEAKADKKGEVPVQVVFRVIRREVQTPGADKPPLPPGPADKIARFLEADARVPIGGKPLQLIKDRKVPADQYAAARMLYDVVNQHMTYKKTGTGWGQGDAAWACDSKYGNCTDFHSLFISLARSEKIPSKFVMGFAIPAKRGSGPVGGYHCWAWFLPGGKGWIPVDISEANQNPSRQAYYFGNLTADRVQFTTGRDITLMPPQKGAPLNFFIYPYVEVDGRPYPADKVERKFSYADVAATSGK
jgi:transglutaminase-like putative cysteine protease